MAERRDLNLELIGVHAWLRLGMRIRGLDSNRLSVAQEMRSKVWLLRCFGS